MVSLEYVRGCLDQYIFRSYCYFECVHKMVNGKKRNSFIFTVLSNNQFVFAILWVAEKRRKHFRKWEKYTCSTITGLFSKFGSVNAWTTFQVLVVQALESKNFHPRRRCNALVETFQQSLESTWENRIQECSVFTKSSWDFEIYARAGSDLMSRH